MEEELDPTEWVLAERLGMTRERLLHEMSNAEFASWRAFFKYRKAMQDFAEKREQPESEDGDEWET